MTGLVLANRYELHEIIGEGGMATVYSATDTVLRRRVAVKLLKQQFNGDREFIENFGNEAQSAASLNHPNIVNIYDVGKEEANGQSVHYIVMEYIEGRTLKECIEADAPFSNERIAQLSSQIAQALRAAHGNHIIHRDIKPQNILVTEDGTVKVTDFGIAKISTSSTITYTSSILGTVHYISPEQAKGKFIDEKSDLYSLGIAMYEMATGHVPFDGDNAVAIAIQHIQDPLIPPGDLNPSLAPGLNFIITKLLEKDSALRYESAESLLGDLSDYKTLSQPISDTLAQTNVMEAVTDPPPPPVKPEPKSDKRSYYRVRDEAPPQEEKKDTFRRVVLPVLLALLFVSAGFIFIRGMLMQDSTTPISEMNEVEVPTIVGLTEERAQKLAAERNIVLEKDSEETSSQFAKGEIIRQLTDPGVKIKPGESVKYVLSLGKQQTDVPSLLNISQQDAESALTRANLAVGDVKKEHSDRYSEGMVIRQIPAAGEKVPIDTPVSITISLGKKDKMITVPNFKGTKKYDAIRQINNLELEVGQIREEHNDDYGKDEVAWQSIDPGQEVKAQTPLDLIISLGPEPTTEPPATDPPHTEPTQRVDYVIEIEPPSPQPDGATTFQVHIVSDDGTGEQDYLNQAYAYENGRQTLVVRDAPGIKYHLYIDGNFVKTITH